MYSNYDTLKVYIQLRKMFNGELRRVIRWCKVIMQGNLIAVAYTLRRLCVHIETSSLWAVFVNKNRCISVRLVSRIFHWFFMRKMDPMSGFDIRLVFTLPPRDSSLQYKRCVHLWNNFPCIITLRWCLYNF